MSTLNEILVELNKQPAVLVTGPQRSGTRIAAHIIAGELGYRYVDEDAYGIHDAPKAQWMILQDNVVVQGPALCHIAHLFKLCAVVIVRRDLQEIRASEDRIGWREAGDGINPKAERQKYIEWYGMDDDNIARLKYFVWDTYQRQQLVGRAFDLDYDSLKESPLWRNKDQRQNFASHQWQ